MSDLPALNWLGYSLNMIGTTPIDTTSVTKAVLTARRIIKINESDARTVVVDGKVYEVPKSIGVQTDEHVIDGFVHYSSGNEAALTFQNDSRLAARFMSITGDPSVGRATGKHHRKDIQYAYYTFGQAKYLAWMRDYADSLNEDALLTAFKTLPKPFNGEDEDNVKKYASFFQRYGTHIITKVQYGAHYQLHIWAPNTNPSVNDAWPNDVKVDYDGIPSSREFDPSVKSTVQYKDYLLLKQRLESVFGGDNNVAQPLIIKPSYPNFVNWVKTTRQNPSLLSFVIDELWSLMKNSANEEIVGFAPTIEKAFNWIVENPKIYKTKVTLTVESDWAEFGLLTPSAVVEKGEHVPELTQWDQTKFIWGREYSHEYRRMTIVFYVINDGYPIDFYISHSSNGPTGGDGKAYINMELNTYKNEGITDNVYNTKWFYRASVTASPERFKVKHSHHRTGISAWDEILQQYLHTIGEEPCANT